MVACEHRHKRHSENYDKQFGPKIKFYVHSLFNRATLSEVLHNQFVANHAAKDARIAVTARLKRTYFGSV